MSKAVKNMIVEDLRQRVGDVREFLVIDSSRLDAVTTNRFRLALREKNITALTVRNSLAIRALGELGLEALHPVLEGASTLVWGGEDIVSLSKEIARWSRELDKLEIKGGTLDGQTLSAEAVLEVSKWPSREELLSIIAGQLLSVAADIASQLTAPATQLAAQLTTLLKKKEEATSSEAGSL